MSEPARPFLIGFLRDQSGATAIEYGLLAALLVVVIAGAVTSLGAKLYSTFGNITNALK